jgi:hypothetical protein
MKTFLSLFCFIILSSMAIAQNNFQDVIYLKNGSVIRGIIIEQVPNTSVKILTADKNVFTFSINEIEKFTKEEAVHTSQESQNTIRQKGFENYTEFSILEGMGELYSLAYYGSSFSNDVTVYSLSTINGWRICPYVFVGIGIGIEKYTSDYPIKYTLPIYLDTKYFILNKKVTPFLYADMGYAWGWTYGSQKNDWAGIMLGAGGGVSYRFTRSSSLCLSVGYRLQQIKQEWKGPGWYGSVPLTEDEISFSNLVVIKIGISF